MRKGLSRWAGIAALSLAPALSLALPAHAAGPPKACALFTEHLAQDYLHTDLERTEDTSTSCDYQSKLTELHRSGSLSLTHWRLASNARSTFAPVCHTKGIKRLSIPGAEKACGLEGLSDLCVEAPSTKRECLLVVKVYFERGRTTGSIELFTLQSETLNDLHNAARLARQVLARWR